MVKKLLTYLFFFSFCHLIAQDAFERTYPSDQNFIGVDIQQTIGGDYLTLSIPLETDNSATKMVNVTRFNPKGNLVWTKNYTFDSTTQVTGALTTFPNGNFAFTTVELQPEMNKVVTMAETNGDILWSRSYGRVDNIVPSLYNDALILPRENEKTNLFSTVYTTGSNEPYLSGLDSLGNIEWAHYLSSTVANLDFELFDARSTVDSGFVIVGAVTLASGNAGAIIKTDSLGNVLWSRSYSRTSPLENFSFDAIHPTQDSGYIAVGNFTRTVSGLDQEGIISKLDSTGNVVWAVITESGPADSIATIISNISGLMDSEDVVIAGRTFEAFEGNSYMWMLQMTSDSLGAVVWQNRYSQISPLAVNQDGLVMTDDGGVAYFGTHILDTNQPGSPYLTKLDMSGSSSCEDTLSYNLFSISMEVDTLIWELTTVDSVMDRETEEEIFSGFNLPTLQLNPPPPFCEGDLINVTFDATVENAVSYSWMPNGEITPSIVATEAGQYIVDVRIETDICYNLCDTATISEIGPPMLEIVAVGSLCSTGADTLIANASGLVESIQWSTGELTPAIFIADEATTFSVVATNQCGSGSASITTQECIFEFEGCFGLPNAFTPDGDSDNDTFNGIISERCQDVVAITNLRIWNRWGQLVYESATGDAWDGMHDGKEAPSDAYLFSMDVEITEDPEDIELRTFKGDVTLIR